MYIYIDIHHDKIVKKSSSMLSKKKVSLKNDYGYKNENKMDFLLGYGFSTLHLTPLYTIFSYLKKKLVLHQKVKQFKCRSLYNI